MSLRVAGSIATAALRTAEVGISVASSNSANADTAGYTRKTAAATTFDTGVGYASVGVSSIGSTVNQQLLKALIQQTSVVGSSTVTDSYLSQLDSSLGSTDGGTDVADALSDLADSMATFATSPESASARVAVVDDLATTAETLRNTSSTVQDLRKQADQDIDSTVDDINETLHTLDDLNDQIGKAKALGQSTADLEDQRNEAVKTLAGMIDISYQVDDNGRMRVSTSSGSTLLDSSVHELSYTPASSVSSTTTFGAITLNGSDITGKVKSGSLGALVELRDETLPDYQAQLDELADTLKETLNDIHNEGTAVPAPQSLTGTTTVAGTDSFSGSGTLRVAITNTDGTAAEVAEFDLSSYSTVQDLVDALNGMTNLSASIDADGKLVLDTGSPSLGVSLGGTDDAVGTDGKGVSAYFGMNDLLVGTGASDLQIAPAIKADSSRLAAGSLSTATGLAAGDTALTSGDGTVASALSAAFSDSQSFDAAGGAAATETTFAGYFGDVVQTIAKAADSAASSLTDEENYSDSLESSFMSESGVNVDEEAAAISALESAYKAAASVMQTLQEMFDVAVNMVS